MKKGVKQTITYKMVSDFEANNRSRCLFCEAGGIESLEDYQPNDIPKGFYFQAFRCKACGRAWREITKFEEI